MVPRYRPSPEPERSRAAKDFFFTVPSMIIGVKPLPIGGNLPWTPSISNRRPQEALLCPRHLHALRFAGRPSRAGAVDLAGHRLEGSPRLVLQALLRAYVSTIAQLETLGRWLHEEEPRSECYCKLLRIQLSVTKTAATLATRLRLTPRSPYDRYQPKVVPNFRKPWEPDPEETWRASSAYRSGCPSPDYRSTPRRSRKQTHLRSI